MTQNTYKKDFSKYVYIIHCNVKYRYYKIEKTILRVF